MSSNRVCDQCVISRKLFIVFFVILNVNIQFYVHFYIYRHVHCTTLSVNGLVMLKIDLNIYVDREKVSGEMARKHRRKINIIL